MSVFINSKKTYEFVNPESGQQVQIPAQYIGSVPDWVPKLWLFRAAVKDTSITYVGEQAEAPKPRAAEKKEKLPAPPAPGDAT